MELTGLKRNTFHKFANERDLSRDEKLLKNFETCYMP